MDTHSNLLDDILLEKHKYGWEYHLATMCSSVFWYSYLQFSDPVISSPLRTRINLSNYPPLNGLQLADCFDDHSFYVDILVGLNAYFDFVEAEA